jgi:hypothetical protein
MTPLAAGAGLAGVEAVSGAAKAGTARRRVVARQTSFSIDSILKLYREQKKHALVLLPVPVRADIV